MEANLSNNCHASWWRDPGLRKLNFLCLAGFLGSIANGFDNSLISGLEATPRWFADLPGLEDPGTMGLLIAAYAFGGILAFIPAPITVDKLGRRRALMLGNTGILAAILGQAFTKSAVQFLGTRIVLGFFGVFNSIGSTTLLSELAHPRQRGIVGALFNTFFFVGSITAAWTCFGAHGLNSVWAWRLPVIMQTFWILAQIAFIVFAPESPRWLAQRGRREEAKNILAKYHANGDVDDELVKFELAEICTSIDLQKSEQKFDWLRLISGSGNRKRFIICVALGFAVQWAGNGIISYYFAPVLQTVGIRNATQQQGINAGLQVWNWMWSITGAVLADRVGRRMLLLCSASIMLLFMILVLACSAAYAKGGSEASGIAVIVFLFFFLGGYVVGFTPIPILYIVEIWPTQLRAKGTSTFWLSQTVALCFNQYVNPIALKEITWKYYFVYVGVLIAIIAFIYFYVPETKGRSLEEVEALFDGTQIVSAAEQQLESQAEAKEVSSKVERVA